jgi:hypothetical protein
MSPPVSTFAALTTPMLNGDNKLACWTWQQKFIEWETKFAASGDVSGPVSATDSHFAQFSGTSGKLLKDGGLSLTTDGTLAADSDLLIPSEKAVKTYVDAHAGGTVTSVGLTVPSRQSVAGSPVTTAGTLAITDNNQSANQVFAGPTSGGAAAPAFRTMVQADLPANASIVPFGITFDGGASPPTTPVVRYIEIPFDCTITSWTITGNAAGSASVDVWFIGGSGAPPTAPNIPTVANKISASAPIVLSAAQSAAGGAAAITTWTPALTKWGQLAFNLSSITTCTSINVQIQCVRT